MIFRLVSVSEINYSVKQNIIKVMLFNYKTFRLQILKLIGKSGDLLLIAHTSEDDRELRSRLNKLLILRGQVTAI